MNAKQRKIADKMRERAELDGSAQLKRLAFERAQFAAEKLQHEKHILTEEARLKEGWHTFACQREDFKKAVADFDIECSAQRQTFADAMIKQVAKIKLLQDHPNLLQEILLELELDEDPAVIALNLRKKFCLTIPEW